MVKLKRRTSSRETGRARRRSGEELVRSAEIDIFIGPGVRGEHNRNPFSARDHGKIQLILNYRLSLGIPRRNGVLHIATLTALPNDSRPVVVRGPTQIF